jgi:hypothetical protein
MHEEIQVLILVIEQANDNNDIESNLGCVILLDHPILYKKCKYAALAAASGKDRFETGYKDGRWTAL